MRRLGLCLTFLIAFFLAGCAPQVTLSDEPLPGVVLFTRPAQAENQTTFALVTREHIQSYVITFNGGGLTYVEAQSSFPQLTELVDNSHGCVELTNTVECIISNLAPNDNTAFYAITLEGSIIDDLTKPLGLVKVRETWYPLYLTTFE